MLRFSINHLSHGAVASLLQNLRPSPPKDEGRQAAEDAILPLIELEPVQMAAEEDGLMIWEENPAVLEASSSGGY